MSRLIRRSLSIIVLLALLLAASAIAAPPSLAREPTDTTVQGINVDETTIPQLQRLMNRDRLTSVQLTRFYLNRIKRLNPGCTRSSPSARPRSRTPARRIGPATEVMTVRSWEFRSSSRTTSTRPGCRQPPAPGRWPGAARGTRSSSSGCALPARSSLARRTCPSGRTSGRSLRRAAGVASVARRTWRMSSTATPVGPARGPASWPPRILPWLQSGPKPMVRSSAPRVQTASWVSSRPLAFSVELGSSRSRPTRTPPAR